MRQLNITFQEVNAEYIPPFFKDPKNKEWDEFSKFHWQHRMKQLNVDHCEKTDQLALDLTSIGLEKLTIKNVTVVECKSNDQLVQYAVSNSILSKKPRLFKNFTGTTDSISFTITDGAAFVNINNRIYIALEECPKELLDKLSTIE